MANKSGLLTWNTAVIHKGDQSLESQMDRDEARGRLSDKLQLRNPVLRPRRPASHQYYKETSFNQLDNYLAANPIHRCSNSNHQAQFTDDSEGICARMIIAIRHVKVLATMPSWLAYQEVLDGNREIQSLVVTGPFNPRAKFKPTSTQHTNGRYVCYINFGIFPNFGAGKDDREKDAVRTYA
ncbi:hypothetical protein L208DRAFT_1459900 [Tricholoma matsutake]|nr:hypothetical protein L208DRAFT_1459900 [Tricholoma matsutake 945]